MVLSTTTCFGLLQQTSFRRSDGFRCNQVKHVVVVKKKNILDPNGGIYLLIKHFINLRLVLQALYNPTDVDLSSRDTCSRIIIQDNGSRININKLSNQFKNSLTFRRMLNS